MVTNNTYYEKGERKKKLTFSIDTSEKKCPVFQGDSQKLGGGGIKVM